MKRLLLLLTVLFVNFQFVNSQNIQSPEEFLGYKIGTRFTRHASVVDYFKHLAENSGMAQYHPYGKTYEGRTLSYTIISSEENLQNLEQIRNQHLQNAGITKGNPENDQQKAVVWLSYNVHGNEASSTEAAIKTIYELLTSRQELLENTIIIMDPAVNPDGRDRYVNWYSQVKATPYNTSPVAVEHNEPWPGGRPNHYLFDLNRDWAWATQVETQQRLKIYNEWMPHIHVDFHEQGIDDPYYFAPAAEPFHEIITPFQREFQTEIGQNNAKYFDEEGWLYFTKEKFDLLYPSYGDTYPTYMGAIGMTYEQAGHGRAGLGIETTEGYLLTLVDRVEHHFTTGLSTIEVTAQNVERLNSEFRKFYQNRGLETKSYAMNGNPDKIAALKKLLDRHEILYNNASSGKIRGYDYAENRQVRMEASENTLVINTNQPKGKMVQVLFEPSAQLVDSLTYDITAWSLPHAYGLEAVASTREILTTTASETVAANNIADPSGAGYITKWNSMQDAKFLSALLKAGIKIRFTEVALENASQQFAPGSLIITKSDNRNLEDFDSKLIAIANKHNRQLSVASTGFATSGPDFGSSSVKIINKPRIAVLRGKETSSLNYGEIWYFFEQELEYPVTSIGTDYFGSADLNQFDVLVLASGRYSDVFEDEELEKLTNWVKSGGKVIALDNAVSFFAGKEGFDLEENTFETEKDSTQKKNLVPYNQRERESIKNLITGSIIETQLDNTHPMAYGYDKTYRSLKLGNDSYSFLEDGYNVGYIDGEPKIISGFAGSEAKKKIANSLVFGEERMGSGSFIYMVDNPLFRAFWENGKLFFVNAVFFVNNENYRM
jgi:hypothetical protein